MRLRLELSDFTGIDGAFAEYRKLNPDIRTIALIEAGEALIHTDPAQVGTDYSPDDDAYEFTQALSRADDAPALRVSVAVPVSVVLGEIWRAGKNFLVLLVATAIVAFLFLDVGSVLQRRQAPAQAQAPPADAVIGDRLTLIRPAYFLVVFLDMLCISFLPQHAAAEAAAAGLPVSWASWPFTIYFIAFAAALIPAGRYAEGGDLKRLIAGGAALALAGMLLLAAGPGFWSVLAGRGISGLGQGLLLIGIQSYLLSVVPSERRTQGQAVQVIGYNGALIAGSAIGALLAVFIGQREVFVAAAAIGALALIYLWRLVPPTRLAPSAEPAAAETGAIAGPAADAGRLALHPRAGADRHFLQAGAVWRDHVRDPAGPGGRRLRAGGHRPAPDAVCRRHPGLDLLRRPAGRPTRQRAFGPRHRLDQRRPRHDSGRRGHGRLRPVGGTWTRRCRHELAGRRSRLSSIRGW